MTNGIFSKNTALSRGPDVLGPLAAGSKNDLLGNGSFATGVADNDANGNVIGHAALVDTVLRDNGATNGTRTLALLLGSPAIDRGDNATCMNAAGITVKEPDTEEVVKRVILTPTNGAMSA